MRIAKLLFMIVVLCASASAQELTSFLAALETHPAAEANRALLRAAEARLQGTYSPVNFTGTGGAAFLFYEEIESPQPLDLPESTVQVDLGFSFRPFLFGDLADLADQQRIEIERSKLSYRETLSALETQAVEAALNVDLAQEALVLAETGLRLAEEALVITQTRFDKGAATDADLRSARFSVQEAENQVRTARASLALAEQGYALLVGDTPLPDIPELEPIEGTTPDVIRASYDVALAEVGVTNSERAFIPTAQASYTVPLEDDKSEVSVSFESRTLQPGLNYSYQNPKQNFAGFSPPPGVDGNILNGTLSIGLSMTLSFETFSQRDAALAQLAAAEAGLQAARDQSDLTVLSLQTTLQTAERGVELATLNLADAQLSLEETKLRQESGLATELELKQAEFALKQAELNVTSANLELVRAVLESYRTYAIPLSEALP